MRVDFSSFAYLPIDIQEIWKEEFEKALSDGIFIGGTKVTNFESAWAGFTGSKYAVGVGNGFDGLVLALRSLNIGNGDSVALPAHTFIATWNAVISVGAIPVGVDVDEEGLLDLEAFEKIASKVQAVMPVHMHGATVDMKNLDSICANNEKKNRIRIIEDASQAHGAFSPDGSALGRYSEVVVYSLYPTKNLGALGDAGIVTTNSFEIYKRIKSLGSYGSSNEDKYLHLELGFNSRLDSIQASILEANLKRLPEWNSVRKELSKRYISALDGSVEILQSNREDSVRHHFCVLTPKRDELRNYLLSKGISTEIHYPRVAGVEALRFMDQKARFPKSERIAKTTLSLPMSQWHSIEQVDYVASQVRAWKDL
jgi:dTDP-4-amino-4,6-dideoxygalactose transaminase